MAQFRGAATAKQKLYGLLVYIKTTAAFAERALTQSSKEWRLDSESTNYKGNIKLALQIYYQTKIAFSLFLLLFFSLGCQEQHTSAKPVPFVTVRFEVEVPGTLYPYTRPFLLGTFNNWTPADSAYVMRKVSENTFFLDVNLIAGDSIEYKYPRGSGWQSVEVDTNATDIANRHFVVRDTLVRRDRVYLWKQEAVNRGVWYREDVAFFQELFLYQHFLHYTNRPQTYEALDALFSTVEEAWRKEAVVHYPSVQRLTSGAYMMAYLIQQSDYEDIPNHMFCYMVHHHALEAMQNEIAYLEADPHPRKASFLPRIMRLMPTGLTCDNLNDDAWEALTSIHRALPDLLAMYLALGEVEHRQLSGLQGLESMLEATHTTWEIKDAFMQNDLVDAASRLKLALFDPKVQHRSFLPNVGLQLADRFAARGDTSGALRVMDLLTVGTYEYELSEDTLRRHYERLDPRQGGDRVAQLSADQPRQKMEGQGTPVKLSGIYLDVTHDAKMDLAHLRGKTVLIDFWATWCGPCIAEIPELIEYAKQVQDREDFLFITVSGDAFEESGASIETLKAFIQEKEINYVVLYDDPENSLAERFDVVRWPTKYLLDKEGKILRQWP